MSTVRTVQSILVCRCLPSQLKVPWTVEVGMGNHPSGSLNGPGTRALVSYASFLFFEAGRGWNAGTYDIFVLILDELQSGLRFGYEWRSYLVAGLNLPWMKCTESSYVIDSGTPLSKNVCGIEGTGPSTCKHSVRWRREERTSDFSGAFVGELFQPFFISGPDVEGVEALTEVRSFILLYSGTRKGTIALVFERRSDFLSKRLTSVGKGKENGKEYLPTNFPLSVSFDLNWPSRRGSPYDLFHRVCSYAKNWRNAPPREEVAILPFTCTKIHNHEFMELMGKVIQHTEILISLMECGLSRSRSRTPAIGSQPQNRGTLGWFGEGAGFPGIASRVYRCRVAHVLLVLMGNEYLKPSDNDSVLESSELDAQFSNIEWRGLI